MPAVNPHSYKLYLVDDDEAVRCSLGMLLLSRGYAVQTFASGETFLSSANVQLTGCVILDLRLGGITGLQVFEALRIKNSPLVVLFFSGHGDIPVALEAVKNGAFSWLEKPCSDEHLLVTISQALEEADRTAIHLRARQLAEILWAKLTPREAQVARCVAEGKPNKRIALDLAPLEARTVETHRANIFAKLDLSNSHELERFIRTNRL